MVHAFLKFISLYNDWSELIYYDVVAVQHFSHYKMKTFPGINYNQQIKSGTNHRFYFWNTD